MLLSATATTTTTTTTATTATYGFYFTVNCPQLLQIRRWLLWWHFVETLAILEFVFIDDVIVLTDKDN